MPATSAKDSIPTLPLASGPTLSLVIPVYNEVRTLARCVERVLQVMENQVSVEVLLVDDGSQDGSLALAKELAAKWSRQIRVLCHPQNQGKGAALKTGFAAATGHFIAVQDADLEYDPADLLRLLEPLLSGQADVVFGSRFLSSYSRRVMYFWHRQINRTLTVLSNMLTDLDLTDMETCYKVFRREILQSIELKENRFGFEPEIVAKVAQLRVRVYEVGISYHARSFAEGKKIRAVDGFRALWCILKYNMPRASIGMQFIVYLAIGGISALFNLGVFVGFTGNGLPIPISALLAFLLAASVNFWLSTSILFRRQARWPKTLEYVWYALVVGAIGFIDASLTTYLIRFGFGAVQAKLLATFTCLFLNFLGRKYLVFYERGNPDWLPR